MYAATKHKKKKDYITLKERSWKKKKNTHT